MRSLNVDKTFLKLVGVLQFLPMLGIAQGQERTITKVSWRSEPIKIVSLKTKGKPIELGKKFVEEDDWLKGLTVTVENVSNKLISRIELSLSFPRAEGPSETIPTYTVPMGYGRDPSDLPDGEAQKPVYPGGSVDVRMPEANLPFIKTDLESLGYPEKITRVEIRVETVTFIDGSMWAGDEILYPDPANPKQKFNPKFPRLGGFKQSLPFGAASKTRQRKRVIEETAYSNAPVGTPVLRTAGAQSKSPRQHKKSAAFPFSQLSYHHPLTGRTL